MPNSTTRRTPAKSHPDFPLFRHATGRWCKKVKGRFVYFGKVADDPKGNAALALWLDQKDALLADADPAAEGGRLHAPRAAGPLHGEQETPS